MPELDDILLQKLQLLEAKQQKRAILSGFRHDSVYVERDGKDYISFSCNDYLGLSQHPRVIAAATQAIKKYGAGAGASRLVTGNSPLYSDLEKLLAERNGTADACVFGSGYLANIGTITALVGKNDLILADKLSHACIIDAARLSGATLLRFAHNNHEHCKMLLEANRAEYQNCLIVTETIFSMDGDIAPLKELSGLAKKYNSWLMTDSAHSLSPLPDLDVPIIKMGTLSKTFGSYGGYVCGSKILIEYLKNAARSLIFSTALPPATLAASIEAIKTLRDEPQLIKQAMDNAILFTNTLGLASAQSTIVPLILGENDKAISASKILAEHGFLITAIRPPTVPENTARLRFTFSAMHKHDDIKNLCAIIKGQGFI